MKKSIFCLMFLALSIMVSAQSSPADKIFEKYSGKEGFTTVYISKYMFELFSSIGGEDPESKEMQDVIKGLNSINILTVEDKTKIPVGVDIYKELMTEVTKRDYKELMVIKDNDQDVRFLIRETDGKVSELLLAVGGNTEHVIISIRGDIDMKSISKLSQMIDMPGIEKLEQTQEK
jgi:hypothetical protein